ncbi:hypothetical protein OJ996_07585 [Luteolibacter sp. GHJ8]|uniref:Uncharacterized protein n=1 Tax=Luteolibacter rhizosphaerae TaxID=2989719 RepID=A0ABT3G0S0_9BACT|nr:hypothetical protein [Luteolibacter rhizosphaerae]MCW1913429.1 hypothetical protein [Luteolibacter rhizosphaerae]
MASSESKPPASRSQVRVLWILGAIVLIALVVVMRPVIIKQKKAVAHVKALSGLRQIGASLFEFDSEYGSFPDDATALKLPEEAKAGFKLSGDHSNDYFRQLIVVGLKSEKPFWCKTSFSPRKPDDDLSPLQALQAGEVGYSYIMAAPGLGQKSSGDPGRPVVVAASKLGGALWTFDSDVYGGKAVVLKLDNSVAGMNIDEESGYIRTGASGRFLQTTGEDTPWGPKATPYLLLPQTQDQ